ncbi:hypothetical protein CSV61_14565 [Sporosarcina sp. P3]|uniref:Ger(x)C family spore germination protein n=1 Tax=Sporosarcina sp. P3 TaxID=2048245 RepID=UPI000C1631DD|nr:Ger(x)C family spore germination protein [Sporosarcina sp. P3]PID20486.1 hypothetical protein CSV61_14565 [Sporosarcina sp. P3]
MKIGFLTNRLILSLCMVCILLQSGCAFKDIDKRLFVTAIGIDPSENLEDGFKITLKVALPFGAIKESTEPEYAYLSKEGESIGEAIRMLETHVDKVLEFGQMKTIVIHEKLLTNHMQSFMDYFFRRGDIPLIAFIAGAKPSAETILKVEPSTEAPASVALFNTFGETANESPYIVTGYLFKLRRDVLTEGINPVLPLVEASEERDQLIVNNAIVVDKKKEAYELTSTETKYFNTLSDGARGFTYHIKNGEHRFLLNISQHNVTYQFVPDEKLLTPRKIIMHMKIKGIIGESQNSLSLSKLDEYNQLASEEVEKKVLHFLTTMQEENLDPLGFGLHYRATQLHDPDVLATWKRAYPDIEFSVTVDVILQGTGSIE